MDALLLEIVERLQSRCGDGCQGSLIADEAETEQILRSLGADGSGKGRQLIVAMISGYLKLPPGCSLRLNDRITNHPDGSVTRHGRLYVHQGPIQAHIQPQPQSVEPHS